MSPDPNPTYANEEEMVADLAGEAKMLGRMFARKWNGKFEPEDLTQVALLAAVSALRIHDPSHGITMRNWIRSKMRWAIHDHIRLEMGRVGRVGRASFVEVSADRCPPALLAVDNSPALFAKLDVERLLTKIRPRIRRIIERHHLEHETLKAIADEESVHLSYIGALDHGGLRAMRRAA
ncbi:MAG TPA: hypothetical protein VHA14_07625 [Bryobacteraceae bacterium]|nr:hypothetical protein [Bryobacteraceae bacterium]